MGRPAISKEAEKYLNKNPNAKLNLFPRPMINKDNLDFSFSGLKTAVLYKTKEKGKKDVPLLSAETQEAIVDSLVYKTLKAVKKYKPKSLLLAGGVAANTRLREKLLDQKGVSGIETDRIYIPRPKLCTDNAAYIASHAFFNHHPSPWEKIRANPELTIT